MSMSLQSDQSVDLRPLQENMLTPSKSAPSPAPKAASPTGASGSSTSNINGDMYIADGDYIKDIEVNDLRNRYTLTKGATQKMVNTLVISTDSPRHLHIRRECYGSLFAF